MISFNNSDRLDAGKYNALECHFRSKSLLVRNKVAPGDTFKGELLLLMLGHNPCLSATLK